jgi:hypothetical protein
MELAMVTPYSYTANPQLRFVDMVPVVGVNFRALETFNNVAILR